MSYFVFEIFGVETVKLRFTKLGIKANEAMPAMIAVLDYLRHAAGATMDSQGRRTGGSWSQLKPATIRRKARLGQDPRIERATGLLYESLTRAGHPNQIANVTKTSATFGSDLPYARAQSKGDPKHNLPARPLIKLNQNDHNNIGRIILDYIAS